MAPQRGRYSHERLVGPMAPPTSSDRPQVHFHQNSEGKPSKNRETLPSVEKKQQHTSQESLETTGKSNNHKGASVLLLQFPPPGSVGPTGSPRAGSPGSGSHSICDLHRHPPPLPNLPHRPRRYTTPPQLPTAPPPTPPTQPSRPPPPPYRAPSVPSPPTSKVVVLGLQVESRFFYPVIINLVYPILFSPLSRVATIRLELPSRGVGGGP